MLAPLHVPAITGDDTLNQLRIQAKGTSFLDFSQYTYLTLKNRESSKRLMLLILLASLQELHILCL